MTTRDLRFGAFLSPLHPPGSDPTWLIANDLALVEHVDRLGFDEFWIGEHHSGGWGIVSSPEVFLAAAAERTRHLRLGTGVVSLPYHNPFMVASRIVQLDHMTRGRVMLGVGAGSLPSDAHMIGVEPGQQRPRTAEALDAVLHLLRSDEPLTMSTDWFDLRDARLQLRPYQHDLEVAISSAASPFSMRLAGRHGLSPLSFSAGLPGVGVANLPRQWAHAEETATGAGRVVSRDDWRLVVSVHVAPTTEQAYAEVRSGHRHWLQGYFGDLIGLPVTPEGVEPGEELEAMVESGGAIVGSPRDCIEAIERLQEVTGGFGTLLVTVQDWAGPQQVRNSFELLASEVVPHFRGSLRRIEDSRRWVTQQRGVLVPKAVTALQAVLAPEPPTPETRPEAAPAPSGAPAYPFGPPDKLEPDPHWARLREHEPVSRVTLPFGGEAWLATRYKDVRTVFADRRFSRAAAVAEGAPRFFSQQPPPDAILSMDPPDHTRLRRLVGKAFGPKRMEQLRPRVQQITDELLAEMERRHPVVDLVEDFSIPLSVTVICELLGVPTEDRDRFRVWSNAVLSTTAFTPEQAARYQAELHTYLGELVARHRAKPGDNLLGQLASNQDEDVLSESELLRLGESILIAGHETTASHIPNFVYTLLRHPEALEKLRGEPALIPDAVQELLRFVPIGAVDGMPRVATEDLQLQGVLIRKGDAVLPSMGSANHDERAFADPDRLDITRGSNPHVAFGNGPHHCLGAPLAVVELEIALSSLLTRFTGLRLAVPEDELRWKNGLIVRGLEAMPVTW
ncbi:LLM class flavin-dependent oxidoreductase [Salinispora pacifica]|uniref:LLM class flavin-dependent oxidoreductase n=1 Tax=Salinispora pacifica TaxID=351187 RepID=UPI000381239A|nr:LLM class flavin-dependent oxidoreductase [Salinispora pacifica]